MRRQGWVQAPKAWGEYSKAERYIATYRSKKGCNVVYSHLGRLGETSRELIQQVPARYLAPSLLWFKYICQRRRTNGYDST